MNSQSNVLDSFLKNRSSMYQDVSESLYSESLEPSAATTVQTYRQSLPVSFQPQTQGSGRCSICNQRENLFSFSCKNHSFCKNCLHSNDLIRNMEKVAKNCKICRNLTESSAENQKNPRFSQPVTKNIPSQSFDFSKMKKSGTLSKDCKRQLKEPEQIKKKFSFSKLVFWRVKCLTCGKKPKTMFKICQDHAICENCLNFFLTHKRTPNENIECKTCTKYFYQSIQEPDCGSLEAPEMNGFHLDVKESARSLESIEDEKDDFALRSDYLGYSVMLPGCESKIEDFNEIFPICAKCEGKNKIIGLFCNHNICNECLADSAFREILEFEMRRERVGGFNYHCPLCGSSIDVPTRMVFKYVADGRIFRYSVSEEYFYTVLWQKVAFYDGVNN